MPAVKNPAVPKIACFGPFRLIADERLLQRGDEAIALGSRALDILISLVERPGEVLSREDLMERAWPNLVVEEANLRVHVARLRKALGDGKDGARYIANVPSRGYSFVAPVRLVAPSEFQQNPVPRHRSDEDNALPPHKLPARLARVVGRERIIDELSKQIVAHRFVSIVGTGGLGKTTVAVFVAHALLDAFERSVLFLDLATITDGKLVTAAVASALGYLPMSRDLLPGLATFLSDRRILLFLDNCEHVIEEAAALAECLFTDTGKVHILTTSREALRAEGEHVHLLRPLDNPPVSRLLTAEEALVSPAVQLFMERATAGGYRPELTDADAPIVADICRRLDGVPLAIELVAGRVGVYGIDGIAKLLNQRFGLVWQGRRTALPRHQTLYAMIDWSHNLLCDRDRCVLRRLSIIVGSFTLKTALEVTSVPGEQSLDVGAALSSLLDKSLLLAVELNGSICYRLLDTTRSYALLKLADAGETDTVAHRHALAICESLRLDAIDARIILRRDLSDYASFMSDIRSALDWAFSERGDHVIATELASISSPLFLGFLLLDECQRWCQQGLAELEDAERGTLKELALQQTLAMAWLVARGNSSEVRFAIERGLELASALGKPNHRLHLLAGLSIYLQRIGEFHEALSVGIQAKRIAVRHKEVGATVVADWMIGSAFHLIGNQKGARKYYEQGFERANALDPADLVFFGHPQRVRALGVSARTLWLCGFPDRAAHMARQSIEEAAALGNAAHLCVLLVFAARVLVWRGELDGAEAWAKRAIAHAARHSIGTYVAHGNGLLGEISIARGELSVGIDLLRKTVLTLHKERHNTMVLEYSVALAEGLARTGDIDEASRTIDEMLTRSEKSNGTYNVADLLRRRAELWLERAKPNITEAEQTLLRSLEVARQQGALGWELRCAISLARLWFTRSRNDEARQLLSKIYQRFIEGFETADLKEAKRLLENREHSI